MVLPLGTRGALLRKGFILSRVEGFTQVPRVLNLRMPAMYVGDGTLFKTKMRVDKVEHESRLHRLLETLQVASRAFDGSSSLNGVR